MNIFMIQVCLQLTQFEGHVSSSQLQVSVHKNYLLAGVESRLIDFRRRGDRLLVMPRSAKT